MEQAPPETGQNTVIQPGTDTASFDVWTGQDWKPWRQVAPSESGLIQVVVTDVAVEESAVGNVFARFQVYLVNAEATLDNFTAPRYRINPIDLGSKEISVNYRVAEYDPLTPDERVRQGIRPGENPFREATGGIDFDDSVVGTLVWNNADENVVKEVVVEVLANPEDELLERFQLELSAFRNVKPLKAYRHMCHHRRCETTAKSIRLHTKPLPEYRHENPNIAAATVPITIRIMRFLRLT